MGFTTPCYITLTKKEISHEVCKKLLRLCYEFVNDSDRYVDVYISRAMHETGKIIISTGISRFYIHRKTDKYLKRENRYNPYGPHIDCGTNIQLFLAIAALRDDTDYMQWFTDGSDFILCDREDWVDMYSVLCCGKGHDYQYVLDKFHKATVEELINHFKEYQQ